jgi:protocatechuate 3,4-dioxygenase beta subunit
MLASLRCFGPLRLAVLLAAGLPIALRAEPIHISGRVQNLAETVIPQGIPGARVELLPQTGETPVATAKADAAGFFELAAPESGCFRVRMRAEGYLNVEAPFLALAEDTDLMPVPAVPASSPGAREAVGSRAFGDWVFSASGSTAVPSPPATPRFVRGKVSGSKGAPVPGALVWSEGAPAVPCVKAGPDGTFQIHLPAGEAKLRALGPGHLPSDPRQVPPPERQEAPLVLALTPAGSITGRVVDAADQPIARVQIAALPLQWRGVGEPRVGGTWSRADGRFRLPLLAPGQLYEVAAVQDGFAPASVKTDALTRDRSPRPVRIVLERGATVLGKLQDPDGKPVRDAELTFTLSQEEVLSGQRLSWSSGLAEKKATSDSAGSFAIPNLVPGQFQLQGRHQGFAPLFVPGIAVPAGTARIDLGALTLERGAAIEGRVTDPAGVPLSETEVNLSPAPDPAAARILDTRTLAEWPVARTDAEGRFRFEDLRQGARFNLRVGHPGYVPAVVHSVEAPTREPLRIELKTGRAVAGRVKSPEGKPVPGAEVFLQADPASGQRSLGATDEEGRFRSAGIQPGTVELAAHAPGYPLAILQNVRIPEDGDVEGLEITLHKGSVLEIQVLDSRRQPVAGALVVAHIDDPGSWVRLRWIPHQCETDEAGRCRLDELDLGTYRVFAQSEKHGQIQDTVEIAPGVNRRDLVFPSGVTVSGRVIDETGAPVGGAALSLSPVGSGSSFEAFSLGDGSFQLPAVTDGTYRLSGAAPGFAETALPEEVQVAGQEVRGLTLRLSRGATLTGKVIGLDPEELAGVSITALRMDEDLSFTQPLLGQTDREGRYRLSELAAGDWRITAEARGRSIQQPLQIAPGVREAVLDFRFPSGYTLIGRVTADGAPLARAQVWVSASSGSFQTLTGPDGGFQIPNVPPGRYALTATGQEGLGTSKTVEVTGDQEVHLDFTTGGLRVTVLAGGAPVANAFVLLRGAVPLFGGGRSRTDAAGSFEVPRLASGTYTVSVQKEGFAPATASVEVRPGAVAAVEIELKPAP